MFNSAHYELASAYKQPLMEYDLNKQMSELNGQ